MRAHANVRSDSYEAAGRAGLCFAKGRGVDQSWERAVHWYKVAAAAGVEDADSMLRKCQKYYVREMAEAQAKRDAADALMKAATHAAEVKAAAEKSAAAEADRLATALASATTADSASKACSPKRPSTAYHGWGAGGGGGGGYHPYCDEGLDDEGGGGGGGGGGGDNAPMWWHHNGTFNPEGGANMLDLCGDVEYEGGDTSVFGGDDDDDESGGGLRGEASISGVVMFDDDDENDDDAKDGGAAGAGGAGDAADMLDDPAEAGTSPFEHHII